MDKEKIRAKLLELGFSPANRGFEYIVEALCLIDEDKSRANRIVSEIYGEIGRSHKTNYAAVERCIRSILKSAMASCSEQIQGFVKLPPTAASGSYKCGDFLAAFYLAMKRE